MRLKNKYQSPPGGFHYTQRETGWNNVKANPTSQWDFKLLCRDLQAHRRAHISRYPYFQVDYDRIMDEVDQVNAARIAKMPGAESYIVTDGPPVPKQMPPSFSQKLERAADAIRKAAIGGGVLLEWERSGDPPVAQELATNRAATCARCPKNGKGDLTRFFTLPASEMIRKQIERVTDLKLETPSDAALGVCTACLCPLKLKVWTPLQFIIGHMPDKMREELDPRCWILAGT